MFEKRKREGVTRRGFLKGAAVGSAAVMINGLVSSESYAKMPKKWDLETDIVVIGGGGAGLAAAVESATQGAKVVVLEKTRVSGGSSAICGGSLAFAGTDLQAAKDVKDSNEIFRKDLMTVGENLNDPVQVQAYLDHQLDTYNWLKKAGVKFLSLVIVSGMSLPRSHKVNPSEVIKILNDLAKTKGAKVFTEVAAKRLILDEKTGRVRGVQVEKKGSTMNYGAKKGVILASGGFSLNKELMAKFVPLMAKARAIVGRGSTGDGLKMAWACGADIKDMPYIKATYGNHPVAEGTEDRIHIYYQGAIIVNKKGKRYVNESISYKLLADACFQQPDAIGFSIYDASIREIEMKASTSRIPALEKKGLIYEAGSIKELAQKIGLPELAVEETIKEYNNNVEKGVDPQFGRTTLVATYGKPVKIEKPPFYAFPSTGVLLGTYGGIIVDGKARVLNVFGEAIPGLYAAGEVTGGLHGAAYMTGTSFGKALVFGRIAAQSVLSEKALGKGKA
jgi:fumarate reductase flavoprotein subunit